MKAKFDREPVTMTKNWGYIGGFVAMILEGVVSDELKRAESGGR